MSLEIRLLGKPGVEREGASAQPPRGRKTWALLAYLLLCEAPPPRTRVASLLFSEAEDPLGALRWTLADLRRVLGDPDAVGGDPLTLGLPEGTSVDIRALTEPDEDSSIALGGELLEGMDFPTSPVFESWLGVMRRHLEGAARAMAHDEALALLAGGDLAGAEALAARLVSQDPLDPSSQELLIRCLALSGRRQAAADQLAECEALLGRELGIAAGPELRNAASETAPAAGGAGGDREAAIGQLEAGQAALDAGAVEPGVEILRRAAGEARATGDQPLEGRALLALGSALVHAVRGRDEEGAVLLHRALRIAEEAGERAVAAAASRELGYIDVQAGRVPSAGRWLARATDLAEGNEELCAVLGVRGMALSDRAHYGAALDLLNRSVARAERCRGRRQAAWSLSLIGRVHILRGDPALAVRPLDESLALVAAERWTAFRPWPEVLRAEAALALGDAPQVGARLEAAFRLACQLGDPCWEAMGARLQGLLAAHAGDSEAARAQLADALGRATRASDSYQWVHAYVLEAGARVAVGAGAADAPALVDRLAGLAERCGFRELVVRAHIHRARLGVAGALEAAQLLASEIDNPELAGLLRPGVVV